MRPYISRIYLDVWAAWLLAIGSHATIVPRFFTTFPMATAALAGTIPSTSH